MGAIPWRFESSRPHQPLGSPPEFGEGTGKRKPGGVIPGMRQSRPWGLCGCTETASEGRVGKRVSNHGLADGNASVAHSTRVRIPSTPPDCVPLREQRTPKNASVAELVDALPSGGSGLDPSEFKSRRSHHHRGRSAPRALPRRDARVAKSVDARGLGPRAARHRGSMPLARTNQIVALHQCRTISRMWWNRQTRRP